MLLADLTKLYAGNCFVFRLVDQWHSERVKAGKCAPDLHVCVKRHFLHLWTLTDGSLGTFRVHPLLGMFLIDTIRGVVKKTRSFYGQVVVIFFKIS